MREVILPGSLEELWRLLSDRPQARVYAGGTDLLVRMYKGLLDPEALICLDRIEELKGVGEQDGCVRIGSCATYGRLVEEPLVRCLPALRKAIGQIGSPLVRNMGTIGGNICTASPAGDTLPPLYAMEAEVELLSREGSRRAPIREFITGPGATCLKRAEILSAVWVKKPQEYNVHHFEKVGLRNALACSVVTMAALLRLGPGGMVEKAAFAWGSVAPTVFSCPEAQEALSGKPLSAASLSRAADLVRNVVRPISDVRADADYRRAVAGNLLLRLLDVAYERKG
ncbi:MAG: xanthine dehydrogenase family protein subunit M [Syntrophobacteraceae bacterium]|nr:xanthine dehydrogenase family protein subunit M [Syntrophobacteraceae bacterium]